MVANLYDLLTTKKNISTTNTTPDDFSFIFEKKIYTKEKIESELRALNNKRESDRIRTERYRTSKKARKRGDNK